MYAKKLRRVCCQEVSYEIVDGKVKNIYFDVPDGKGCKVGLTVFSNMAEGMEVEKVISLLIDTDCRGMGTSCYRQFAKELKKQIAE